MELRTQVAAAVKAEREARKWRQKDVLDAARRLGADWSANAISEIESGRRRADTADVLAVLCLVFDIDVVTLLDDRKFDLAGRESTAQDMIDALNGESELQPSSELPGTQRIGGDNPVEVQRMADRLGVDVDQLRALVMAVYGAGERPIAKRDEIAGVSQTDTSRSAQAKRGHATRRILSELRAAMDEEGADAVIARGQAIKDQWHTDAFNMLNSQWKK